VALQADDLPSSHWLEQMASVMLYMLDGLPCMDSPLGAPEGLGGSLLVQHCIEGAQLALHGFQDPFKFVLLHLVSGRR
jgi:hypothetical protein